MSMGDLTSGPYYRLRAYDSKVAQANENKDV